MSGSSNVEIGLLSAYVGKTVTVAGLVTETASDTATIDDGTGQVRIGGPSAADVLTMLEPGDAIEVTGLVQQDDLGLIIEADPASIVDLPGETAPTADSGLIGLVAGAPTPSTAASEAAAASIRRASPSAPPPNVVALLAVLLDDSRGRAGRCCPGPAWRQASPASRREFVASTREAWPRCCRDVSGSAAERAR